MTDSLVVNLASIERVPDSGKEKLTEGDNSFFANTICFEAAILFSGIDAFFVGVKSTAVIADDVEKMFFLHRMHICQGLIVSHNRVIFGRDKAFGYSYVPIMNPFSSCRSQI